MSPNTFTALCGRLGLILAFVLIAGIVAGPLLPRIWSPQAVLAQR